MEHRAYRIAMLPFVVILTALATFALTSPVSAQDETPPSVPEETPLPETPPVELLPDEQPATPAEVLAEVGYTLTDANGEPIPLVSQDAIALLEGGDPWFKVGSVTYNYLTITDAINAVAGGLIPTDGLIHIEGGGYTENVNVDSTSLPTTSAIKGLIGEINPDNGLPLVMISGYIRIDGMTGGFSLSGMGVTGDSRDWAPLGAYGYGAIDIFNTTGIIALKDIKVSNADPLGIGLSVYNKGAINLTNFMSYSNNGGGAYLYNTSSIAPITIYGGIFQQNGDASGFANGLRIYSRGAVTLNGVVFSHNTGLTIASLDIQGSGVLTIKNTHIIGTSTTPGIQTSLLNANINLENVHVDENTKGLWLTTSGNITLNGVAAMGNTQEGAFLDTCQTTGSTCTITSGTGIVTVNNSKFNSNLGNIPVGSNAGLVVKARGAIVLNNVESSYNTSGTYDPAGADLSNADSSLTSPVTVNNSIFDKNDYDGLRIFSKGLITLNKVHAGETDPLDSHTYLGNGYSGAYLDNSSGTAGISILGTANGDNVFSYNLWGVNILTKGPVLVNYTETITNGNTGISIINDAGTGGVTISNGTFNNNSTYGMEIVSKGAITLKNVQAGMNHSSGATITNSGLTSTVSVTNSEFSNNQNQGLRIQSNGNITLFGTSAYNNQNEGADLNNFNGAGNITITNGSFSYNGTITKVAGLTVRTRGTITLTSAGAWYNSGQGAHLENHEASTAKTVTITNGSFNNNRDTGLWVQSKGLITLKNVSAFKNSSAGAEITPNVWVYETLMGEIDSWRFQCVDGDQITVTLQSKYFSPRFLLYPPGSSSAWEVTDDDHDGTASIVNPMPIIAGIYTIEVTGPASGSTGPYALHVVKVGASDQTPIQPQVYGAHLENIDGTAGVTIINNPLPSSMPTLEMGFSLNNETGLHIRTDGAITVSNIWAGRNNGFGFDLDNTSGITTGITLTNVRIFENFLHGLYAFSNGSITLSNTASYGQLGPGSRGAVLSNGTGVGSVKITNLASTDSNLQSGFSNNPEMGLVISTHGTVSLVNVNAFENKSTGIEINNQFTSNPGVTLSNTRAGNNEGIGILVRTNGVVLLSGGSSRGNLSGVDIENNSGPAVSPKSVTVSWMDLTDSQNENLKITSLGSITLSNVYADRCHNASCNGIFLDNHEGSSGIVLTNVNSCDHRGRGIDILTRGSVTFSRGDILFNNEGGLFINKPLVLDPTATTVSISNVSISGNSNGLGLFVYSTGNITLTNVICDQNAGGADLNNSTGTGNVSILTTGTSINKFVDNTNTGLKIRTKGAVILNKVEANNNILTSVAYGVDIDNTASLTFAGVTLTGGHFNDNSMTGIQVLSKGQILANGIEARAVWSGIRKCCEYYRS
jgi:hypothetical protein